MICPQLILPSWAINEDILDRIEGVVLAANEALGTDTATEAVLWRVDTMRQYLRHGVIAMKH